MLTVRMQSDDISGYPRDSLYIRQLLLLTDLYGKTRTPEGDLHGNELEKLLHAVRRTSPYSSRNILLTSLRAC